MATGYTAIAPLWKFSPPMVEEVDQTSNAHRSFAIIPTPFQGAVLAVFIFCLVLRFWRLGQFNQLVFDEIYYAKFAGQYWLGETFFPSHPPLGHYLIALGMAIGDLFPVAPDQVNDLTGVVRSTWSYRWLNALVGSTIPLLMGAIAYLLTARRLVALLTMVLLALDGMLLVESRYALNNIYLLFFGLLGQALLLWYLQRGKSWQLITAGMSLACAGTVKWNGLSFLLAVYIFWVLAWGQWGWRRWLNKNHHNGDRPLTPFWQQWLNISPQQLVLWLGILPLVTYSLLWIPHLLANPDYASLGGFWRIQVETWQYHRQVGSGTDIHPYCSPWYSWPVMVRPIAYFYEKSATTGLIQDVHSMANPFLIWFATGSMVLLLGVAVSQWRVTNTYLRGGTVYIAVNYLVNLLPWVGIGRCTFFYHYLPAYTFSILALALLLANVWHTNQWGRYLTIVIVTIIAISFWFWLPLFLGLPLTPRGFALRLWFPSWI